MKRIAIAGVLILSGVVAASGVSEQDSSGPADNPGSLLRALNPPNTSQTGTNLDRNSPTSQALQAAFPSRAVPSTIARASRDYKRPKVNPTSPRKVSSTAYCLKTKTATGKYGYAGSVAMNGVPLGSHWKVLETGTVYTVEDRIGSGSSFDIWMSSCPAAINYGRRTLTVVQV